ncbi:hypothetical protein AKG11_33010 [Shinella sp. SUS2]|uniref:hypothetical protein n=1 Tax=unclassified Shinella TaxID=2643062 RepID=UPI000681340C|nr:MULTISPECIES: hypothetical protein [unclassified Shinella]KNY10804.1 hypothetical protein AKG11_33010 [Shinella sp. SUS2]KOC71471.1 hypothetical protein AKG10_32865 [Shinella sp. GWS1]
MAVISSAFGQVKLTDDDAKKFRNQVTYGKPKASAVKTASRGSAMFKEYQTSGKVTFKAKAKPGK